MKLICSQNRVEGTPIATGQTVLANQETVWFAGRTPNEAGLTTGRTKLDPAWRRIGELHTSRFGSV
jgi:hypothetical protein